MDGRGEHLARYARAMAASPLAAIAATLDTHVEAFPDHNPSTFQTAAG